MTTESGAFVPFTKGTNPFAKKGTFADPGYLKDKKSRFPLDTPAGVRAAWASINTTGTAAKYTPGQRATIKSRITTAAKLLKVSLGGEKSALADEIAAHEFRVAQHFDQMMAEAEAVAAERAVVTVRHKAKAGKHRFVSTKHVHDAMYQGAGWNGMCVACSKDEKDPDHDGDLDTPGAPDDDTKIPVAASMTGITTTWPSPLTVTATGPFTINTTGTVTGYNISAVDRPTGPLEGMVLAAPAPAVKAFLTELNGKTLLTGPAATFVPAWEKALTPNRHMLWLQGRFVGAEKANRNGAFWSTADLELGEATVRYGPLNWLHEAKHIIGTIADTRLVAKDHTTDEPLTEPYIQAASAIWSWIYRDESSVVEMASDSGKLWYSMECISENVECVGDAGCGMTIPYVEYVSGEKACEHMLAHTATRRFADPTFLGGAVIMPPARPGWAEADAQVMREAASLAEAAFEQAGQPDIPASQWEQLMAGVVRFAS